MNNLYRRIFLPMAGLCASIGTLLCCALPALLVSVGMGAAMAGMISAMPWITALSEYKLWVFSGGGFILAMAVFAQWRGRFAPCPTDPAQAKLCARLRKINIIVTGFALIIYIAGAFFAFFAADFLL